MKQPFRKGDIVTPRWFINAQPFGLSIDCRCVVVDVRARDKRIGVKRDDNRDDRTYWLDYDAARKWGSP